MSAGSTVSGQPTDAQTSQGKKSCDDLPRSTGRTSKMPLTCDREQPASRKLPKFCVTETSADWLSGKFGTKECVLRFRLAALNNTDSWQPTNDQSVIDTPPRSSGRYPGNASKILEPSNFNTPPRKPTSSTARNPQFVGNLLLKKRSHQSLSSSDTSISSSCDEPAETEDDRPIVHGGTVDPISCTKEKTTVETATAKSDMESGKENRGDSQSMEVSEMPARALQIGYRFANTETKLLRRILNSHGMLEMDDSHDVSLLWTGAHVKTDVLRNLKPHQRVNHFPRSYELTRKDRLYKNIEKMQHLRGFKQFDIVPMSFMLPAEYRNLVSVHRSSQKMPWIVKPAASSRGRGIFLVHSPEQIPQDEQVLVSRYISNPLCIDGHKCDIRLYVVVTSFDPLNIYMYEEGLVRLATVKYDKNVENLWNPCMHLCNYSINKYHSDYIKATETCEDVGHKWTFSALLRHLRQQGSDTQELMANIEDVIVKSILSCTQSIASACRMFVPSGNNCFELYGYDILIDDQLKPWLLEVNMSPSLGIDTPLDTKVKASAVADLLTLVGIPVIDPSTKKPDQPKWSRFRNAAGLGKCRKTTTTTEMPPSNKRTSGPSNSPVSYLTQEELRIVRHARAQHSRRGGFVRIYPTVDSLQRYGNLLDSVTGIPISTPSMNGSSALAMIVPHNYNMVLYNQLFTGIPVRTGAEELADRMIQYERVLSADGAILLQHNASPKCVDEVIRLRRLLRRSIENQLELSQLQARRLFHRYLECVLMRLATEPPKTSQQEKWILKFITRSETGRIKTPSFIKNPSVQSSQRIHSKDRSALVAKLLGDYLEAYHRDSEGYVDDYDLPGAIPRREFYEFLSLAQENDLENILTLHTNITQSLPFLSSRSIAVPPPIPTGSGGFLRALPAMVRTTVSNSSIDNYYKSLNTLPSVPTSPTVVEASTKPLTGAAVSVSRRRSEKIMSTSVNFPSTSSSTGKGSGMIKRRSVSQTSIHR